MNSPITHQTQLSRQAPSLMHRVRRIHLVGIGGAGMCGIAEVLSNLGFEVSGSDCQANAATERLMALGIEVSIGHDPKHIEGADVVVVSGAIASDNPECVAAHQHRIPVVARAEMLGELMRFRHGIAVAGSHGKTTTTSMIAAILAQAGQDPTFVVGGLIHAYGTNARLGQGNYLVAEADESDGSFLQLQPMMALVTNIDRDHLDAYQGSFDQLQSAFLSFLHHLPFYGVAVLGMDDPHVAQLIPSVARNVVTYGFNPKADVRATDVEQDKVHMRFQLWLPDHDEPLPVKVALPGRHAVQNALGAAAVAWELGVSAKDIQQGLADFSGVGRRFDSIGEFTLGQGQQVLAFEDYGHHPTELDAVIAAARGGWPDRRLVVVFQPHRYTRTRDQFDAFARVLTEPDVLVLADIYAAGETPIAGIDADALAQAIEARGLQEVARIGSVDEAPECLDRICLDQDLVLVMGAGDVGRLGQTLRGLAA